MNSNRIISFCANLEQKLDTCLFAKRDDDRSATPRTADPAKITGGAVKVGIVGGAAAGGAAAHRAILRNYGGEGGAREAYRNLGRNAVESVAGPAREAVGHLRTASHAALGRARSGYSAARDIAGLNPISASLRGARKAANPLLSRVRKVVRK